MSSQPVRLPRDDHVHSEWSYDASAGSMDASCARALALGLPSVAFTEHVDWTVWFVPPGSSSSLDPSYIGSDRRFRPPPLDTEGYLASLARCRARYQGLRILSGVEIGEPHWFGSETEALVATRTYERVLGSLHTVHVNGEAWNIHELFGAAAPEGVTPAVAIGCYLSETLRMVESSAPFEVLAHIDYPVRRWPAVAGPFDAHAFEDDFRTVLGALASSGRALEVNTRIGFDAAIVRWWYEAGGDAVTFGSDAHRPDAVASGFAEAAAMVEAAGFRESRNPADCWYRYPRRG